MMVRIQIVNESGEVAEEWSGEGQVHLNSRSSLGVTEVSASLHSFEPEDLPLRGLAATIPPRGTWTDRGVEVHNAAAVELRVEVHPLCAAFPAWASASRNVAAGESLAGCNVGISNRRAAPVVVFWTFDRTGRGFSDGRWVLEALRVPPDSTGYPFDGPDELDEEEDPFGSAPWSSTWDGLEDG